MLQTPLLLLAALSPQDSWMALELPRICEERRMDSGPGRLALGRHVRLTEESAARSRGSRILLSAADLGTLLQQSAGASHASLRFSPYSPPLYASGTAEDLEWARKAVAAASAAGERQQLTISAWLVPGAPLATAPEEGALPPGSMSWEAEILSGDEVSFGEHLREEFVASYDVEVSSHSGVAAPVLGQVTTGKTVQLSVCRVNAGRRFHLRGQLDLAELQEFNRFDPDTPDLGQIMQPVVKSASVVFSAVGEMGSVTWVEVHGAPLAEENWKLWIRVDGVPEPSPPESGSEAGLQWRAVDVSLLERRPPDFSALHPGAGLTGTSSIEPLLPAFSPISAAGVLSAVQAGNRSGRGGRSSNGAADPYLVCEGLLLFASGGGTSSLATRVEQFLGATERPRLQSTRVELGHGALSVSLPTALGEVARVWIGTEQPYLTGYSSEIAPNTWMPTPQVELALDGLAWQGQLGSRRLKAEAWVASTSSVRLLSAKEAQLGALQLPSRRIHGAQMTVSMDGQSRQMLAALVGVPALRMSAAAR